MILVFFLLHVLMNLLNKIKIKIEAHADYKIVADTEIEVKFKKTVFFFLFAVLKMIYFKIILDLLT